MTPETSSLMLSTLFSRGVMISFLLSIGMRCESLWAEMIPTADQAGRAETNESPTHSTTPVSKESLWRFAPLPSIAYNIERGVGYGAYLTAFKKKTLPEGVRGVRYEYSLSASLFQTTGGYKYHKLLFDAPYLSAERLRFQGILGYESQDTSWYSGVGDISTLISPLVEEGHYLHPLRSVWFMPSLTQPLPSVSPALNISLGWIGRYAMVEMPAQAVITQENPRGSEGGFLSSLQGSVSWDNRDREPDTQRGVWTELSIRGAHGVIGSDWSYWAINVTHRNYLKLSQAPWLVFAYRLGLDWQLGEPPFFQRGVMGGVQWTELGGNSALRGYKFGRFRGDRSLYFGQELRYRYWRFYFKQRPIDLLVTPIIDLGIIQGRDESRSPQAAMSRDHWLWGSVGMGGRAVYDQGFVVRVDVMWALERVQDTPVSPVKRRAQLGVFAMTGHSF